MHDKVELYELPDLIRAGGNEWKRQDEHRIYFNKLDRWIGLEFPKGPRGEHLFPRRDGKPLQDREAAALLRRCEGTKIFYDVKAGKWRAKQADPGVGRESLTPEEIREIIKRIKDRVWGEELPEE